MTDAARQLPQQQDPASPRSWSALTFAALILAGLGLVFSVASGIGLPFALAGAICSGIAIQRDRAARPWPLVALGVSLLGTVIGAILLVITVVTWAPLVPTLLFS